MSREINILLLEKSVVAPSIKQYIVKGILTLLVTFLSRNISKSSTV